MAKEKVTSIFNKNHIVIMKYEYTNNPIISRVHNSLDINVDSYVVKKKNYNNALGYVSRAIREKYSKTEKEEVRLKSPLGFYYTKVIWKENQLKKSIDKIKTGDQITWLFIKGTTKYELSYYSTFGSTSINHELRPWDIVQGDKSWEDHFTKDLLDEVDKIIEFASNKELSGIEFMIPKNSWFEYKNDEIFAGRLKSVRSKIFTDLFGYPDGPKYQTNEEKILAAGFDLKTSFRKV